MLGGISAVAPVWSRLCATRKFGTPVVTPLRARCDETVASGDAIHDVLGDGSEFGVGVL